MNFDYSDEQQQLADSLQKYLASQYGFEQRKAILNSASGVSDAAWATFAEMGLTAIALPEADGGFGGGAVDLMAAMEACGAALVVGALLDNVALAGRLLARCGSAAQRGAWMPGLIAGSVQLAFAGYEPGRRYDPAPATTPAPPAGRGWALHGRNSSVVGPPSRPPPRPSPRPPPAARPGGRAGGRTPSLHSVGAGRPAAGASAH